MYSWLQLGVFWRLTRHGYLHLGVTLSFVVADVCCQGVVRVWHLVGGLIFDPGHAEEIKPERALKFTSIDTQAENQTLVFVLDFCSPISVMYTFGFWNSFGFQLSQNEKHCQAI